MNKQIFIITGFGSNPKMFWFPWLKNQLEDLGYTVNVPRMPTPLNPKIKKWTSYLSSVIKNVDEDTYFIGHSIGCQAILRYIEQLPADKKVGGILLVAPFLELDEDAKKVLRPWIETPIDFRKIKKQVKNIAAIFSDDDPLIPISNKKLFEKKLGAKTTVVHEYDHFVTFKEMPELLPEIAAFMR